MPGGRYSAKLSIWSRNSSETGAGEKPQLPTTSVVTPWRILDSARRLAQSRQSEWVCTSMNPGVTMRPAASMIRPAGSCARSPMAAIVASLIPTSARRPTAPVPSTTRLPVILSSIMAWRNVTRTLGPRPPGRPLRRGSALHGTRGEARDVVVDEEGVDERDGNRSEQGGGHELAPVEHV